MSHPYVYDPYCREGACNPIVQGPLDDLVRREVRSLQGVRRILDLGCGNGLLGAALAKEGYEVVGVDASESGIEIARKTHPRANLRFECARIDEAFSENLSGERFDLVVSCDVIEHLYQPRLLLRVACEVLHPRGYIILTTPYHGWLKNVAISVLGKWDAHHAVGWDGGHIKFFSVRTLGDMLHEQGLEVVKYRFLGRAPFLWKNMICVARRQGEQSAP